MVPILTSTIGSYRRDDSDHSGSFLNRILKSREEMEDPQAKYEKGEAEKYKILANNEFSNNRYEDAANHYSKAIDLDGTNPIYYSNRAQTRIKLELYAGALEDANKALELDPSCTKARYRRASAQWMLGNFKEALADLVTITRQTNDNMVARKLADLKKEFLRIEFEKAIHVEDTKVSLEVLFGSIEFAKIEDSYDGPVLNDDDDVTVDFVERLVEALRNQKKLHKRCLYNLLIKARNVLREEPNIVSINVSKNQKLTVCGDVHGQYYDLLHIFEMNGNPSPENVYLFNGDFVDRGSFSVECAITLLSYKCLYPSSMFISRGNHETEGINVLYGFRDECKSKYSEIFFKGFTDVFENLPLGHIIMDKVLVIHGGLFSIPDVTIDRLQKLDRFGQPEDELTKQLLWSDPKPEPGISDSYRGIGIQFGPDITKSFCEKNNLKCIIRSHEMKTEGYQIAHDGMCITIFSAPNYCDKAGNKGAIIVIDHLLNFNYVTFEAVPHPAAPSFISASPFRAFGY